MTAPVQAGTLGGALDWYADNHPLARISSSKALAQRHRRSPMAIYRGARSAARGLRELNIAAGDRVAIMLPTGESFVPAFFGAL